MKFKSNSPATKDTRLEFGQYKGRLVRDVMKFDAQYLLWAQEIGKITISPEILDEIKELADEQHRDYLQDEYGYYDIYDNY